MKAIRAIKVIKAVKAQEASNLFNLSRLNGLIALLLLSASYGVSGQELTYSYFYRVYFMDKGDNIASEYSASDLLSSRAVSRRQKSGITVPDFRDFPVNKDYLKTISLMGLHLHSSSKWMNTALFKSQSAFDINKLLSLEFVSDVKIVKTPEKKKSYKNKLDFETEESDLPTYDLPLTMVNGYPIHDSGFEGKGILIAIFDGGFMNADEVSSLKELRSRNGIIGTYDFVSNSESVYNASTHGTAVLSVLAGRISGLIEGTAPGADYLLLKTEDIESEFPCEEDFWTAGAEFADSTGADIISSSLGYYNFDDPSLNYKSSELDGNTSFITQAADIAASKGILVVNSAGNERNKDWKRIIFPSDGDSVLAVGAVDGNKIISDFSSAGPSTDGRIKPDNVALGVSIPVQTSGTLVVRSNGTSFSCPVLSGMAACLMQAVPNAVNSDIIKVMHTSADRFNSPDSLYGYGIPDMVAALNELQNLYLKVPDEGARIFPNPTTGSFEVIFSVPPENLTVEIISMTGESIFRKNFSEYAGRSIIITELQTRNQGIYFLRIKNESGMYVRKIIKIGI
jgi:serine protease AprX